jgi:DNA-binding MarR family transcriptional regulator
MNVTKSSDLDHTILPWLGRTMKAMDYYVIDFFKSKGLELTKPQMIVLKVLSRHDGIVQNNLAFITNRDKTSLTRLIDTMEKKGLVQRSVSEKDKRVKLVHITNEGNRMLEVALPILGEIIQLVQTDIKTEDLEVAIKVLKQIGRNIKVDEFIAPLNQ